MSRSEESDLASSLQMTPKKACSDTEIFLALASDRASRPVDIKASSYNTYYTLVRPQCGTHLQKAGIKRVKAVHRALAMFCQNSVTDNCQTSIGTSKIQNMGCHTVSCNDYCQ